MSRNSTINCFLDRFFLQQLASDMQSGCVKFTYTFIGMVKTALTYIVPMTVLLNYSVFFLSSFLHYCYITWLVHFSL